MRRTKMMNAFLFTLKLQIIGFTVLVSVLPAQEAPRPSIQQPKRVALPPTQSVPSHDDTLSTNYRVVFSGKVGDKALGELSTLTCSPQLQVTGPLDPSQSPTIFTVAGTLEEKDQDIIFEYQIAFSYTVQTENNVAPQANGPIGRSTQYQQHSCSGTLKLKPGKNYEILKSGGVVYSIAISPEGEN